MASVEKMSVTPRAGLHLQLWGQYKTGDQAFVEILLVFSGQVLTHKSNNLSEKLPMVQQEVSNSQGI